MTDWLTSMPDKCLPNLKIRQELFKLERIIRVGDHRRPKESYNGKVVMYLYEHPKELKVLVSSKIKVYFNIVNSRAPV